MERSRAQSIAEAAIAELTALGMARDVACGHLFAQALMAMSAESRPDWVEFAKLAVTQRAA